ncbi:hypothetical protein FYK55_03135 [Roseiconus nitratireducens]|uniref:HAMP domain-containing protein n=1 Tax=Roseiconus nitratireducens TaxID=2605748 RepID=A0A5M6DED4_9BACT|nr:hypothetical protein [Roseiconus nitratireducens]KAA5545921.1 hypothetical protein FYK55_03135 [Roseiconus nitratireducens]
MSQRNLYLSDPKVQWALVSRVLTHWCLMLFCLLALSVFVRVAFYPVHQSFMEALRESLAHQVPLLVIMVMLVPVFLRDMVKLSHRFAGPMTRLRGALNELAEGKKIKKLEFRPDDFWQDAATDFNRLYAKHLELRDRCEELQKQLDSKNSENHGTVTG